MAGYGYSGVTDKGFSAFSHDLNEGAWKNVSIAQYEVEDKMPAALLSAPRVVVWKLRATWAIAALDQALGIFSSDVKALDAEWDSAQRALDLFLLTAVEHKDPAVREAAGRLRKGLLDGAGASQTNLGYDQEVDYGIQQLSRVGKEPLAADAAKIAGLNDHLTRIQEATAALGKGIGRGTDLKRPSAPSKRLRDALSGCSIAFNVIHEDIAWHTEHTPPGPDRETLQALQAPFRALLARYPARGAVAGSEDAGEEKKEEGGGEGAGGGAAGGGDGAGNG